MRLKIRQGARKVLRFLSSIVICILHFCLDLMEFVGDRFEIVDESIYPIFLFLIRFIYDADVDFAILRNCLPHSIKVCVYKFGEFVDSFVKNSKIWRHCLFDRVLDFFDLI